MPHERQASAIRIAPQLILPMSPCHDSSNAPATMATAPMNRRVSTCSRNTTQARSRVNTASRLSRSEAEAASVRLSPNNNRTGPKTPPKKTVPASHGKSLRRKPASPDAPVSFRNAIRMLSPSPNPDTKGLQGSRGQLTRAEALPEALMRQKKPQPLGQTARRARDGSEWSWWNAIGTTTPYQ